MSDLRIALTLFITSFIISMLINWLIPVPYNFIFHIFGTLFLLILLTIYTEEN